MSCCSANEWISPGKRSLRRIPAAKTRKEQRRAYSCVDCIRGGENERGSAQEEIQGF